MSAAGPHIAFFSTSPSKEIQNKKTRLCTVHVSVCEGLGWEPPRNIHSMTPDGHYPLLINPQTQQEFYTLLIIHMSAIRAVFF